MNILTKILLPLFISIGIWKVSFLITDGDLLYAHYITTDFNSLLMNSSNGLMQKNGFMRDTHIALNYMLNYGLPLIIVFNFSLFASLFKRFFKLIKSPLKSITGKKSNDYFKNINKQNTNGTTIFTKCKSLFRLPSFKLFNLLKIFARILIPILFVGFLFTNNLFYSLQFLSLATVLFMISTDSIWFKMFPKDKPLFSFLKN